MLPGNHLQDNLHMLPEIINWNPKDLVMHWSSIILPIELSEIGRQFTHPVYGIYELIDKTGELWKLRKWEE